MFAHYANVWSQLPTNSFTIILLHSFMQKHIDEMLGGRELIKKLQELGYEYRFIEDVLRRREKYLYVISNHRMQGTSLVRSPFIKRINQLARNYVKISLNWFLSLFGILFRYQESWLDPRQYLPLQVGVKQVRFMYGADISDGWSLQDWNHMYDLFLCHGPNDEKELKKKFKGKTAIMGYPRYDGYFSNELDVDSVIQEFNIDIHKKTILWMPTYDMFDDGICSISLFAEPVSKLFTEYNVIVRPHPISFRLDINAINLLKQLNYNIDSNPSRDMNALYKIADTVLCDHGGSAFGALYLKKKLVFLDTEEGNDCLVGKQSSNEILREHFPIVTSENVYNLPGLIEDDKFWEDSFESWQDLFARFFDDSRGYSSRKTAEILCNIDDVVCEGMEIR